MVKERYTRNIPAISEEEQAIIEKKHVLVIGCGGLGGFIIEMLARLGVGEITCLDGDVFDYSNLNRQILSNTETLGRSKALVAAERVAIVNPDVKVNYYEEFFDEHNAAELVESVDLVIDALDNAESRLLLEDVCEEKGKTIVHGAIMGWNAQVTVVRPGSRTLHKMYQGGAYSGNKTSLAFNPPFCASIEVAEALKLLCGREPGLEKKLLMVNLVTMDWDIIRI